MIQPRGFFLQCNSLSNNLISDVKIGPAFDPTVSNRPDPKGLTKYKALWDTGATSTVITKPVVGDCGLIPTNLARVTSATETRDTFVYYASIWLPNMVCFPFVRVLEAILSDKYDLLIGMDIIVRGDFAVNNSLNVTSFTFRTPSIDRLDFTRPPQRPLVPLVPPKKKTGRGKRKSQKS